MLQPYFYNIGWKYSKMCSLVLTSLNALHYVSFCLRLVTQSPVDVYEAVCPHTKRPWATADETGERELALVTECLQLYLYVIRIWSASRARPLHGL